MGKTFGLNAVDWEQRVDVDRLRRQRLERIGGLLERSELGALLCFDMNNIRYITATHIGTWAMDKLARFSLLARGAGPPVEANASNMLWCLLPAALVNLVCLDDFNVTAMGLWLAVASGAVATGFGYIVWYLVVRALSAAHAATVQLSMPVLTAVGGLVFLAEPFTLRLLIASAAMLGGIALVLARRPSVAR